MSEIERLRDRVDELEELLGIRLKLPNEFGLTPMETKYVGVLIRREIANRDMIFNAIYGGLSDRDPKIIDVHICKIRKKLAAKGFEIKNRYGEGYYLEPEARASLKEACAL